MATTKAQKAPPTKRRAKLPPLHKADDEGAVKKFKKREGYRLVTLGAERWHWYLCGIGILAVKPLGYRPLDTIKRVLRHALRAHRTLEEARRTAANGNFEIEVLERVEAQVGMGEDELLEEFAAIFFAATFPFYEHTFDDVLAMMTQRSLAQLTEAVTDEMRLMASAVPAVEGKTGDDGKEGNLTTGR